MEYALPVYNLQNLPNVDDTDVQFTVSDSNFLKMLLMRIRGETIKFASALKQRENIEEKNLKTRIESIENNNPSNLNLCENNNLEKMKSNLQVLREKKTWSYDPLTGTKFIAVQKADKIFLWTQKKKLY